MPTGQAQPGAIVPSGALVTPGGPQGIGGLQGPSGPNAVSTDAGNLAALGTDSRIYVPAGAAFILKTSAYAATFADSGKEIICSGGSWVLTLPPSTASLTYDVRNDMGISGTTGTITIAPTTGTIDGLASLALLPQQECKLRCDGTNWRSFGLKREVILGTQDISSTSASGSILLPSGYRFFELTFTRVNLVTDNNPLIGVFSSDGGSTWLTASNYREGQIYDSSATAIAYAYASQAFLTLTGNTLYGQSKVIIFPGSTTDPATWSGVEVGYQTGGSRMRPSIPQGFYNANLLINALKYSALSGNISTLSLTVKGVV